MMKFDQTSFDGVGADIIRPLRWDLIESHYYGYCNYDNIITIIITIIIIIIPIDGQDDIW